MAEPAPPAPHTASLVHVFEKVPRRHIYKVIRIDYNDDGEIIAKTQVGEIRGARDGGGLLFTAYTMDNTALGSHRAVFPLRPLFEKRLKGFSQGSRDGFLSRTGRVGARPETEGAFVFDWTITGTTVIYAKDRKTAQHKFDRMNRAQMLEYQRTESQFSLDAVHDPEPEAVAS